MSVTGQTYRLARKADRAVLPQPLAQLYHDAEDRLYPLDVCSGGVAAVAAAINGGAYARYDLSLCPSCGTRPGTTIPVPVARHRSEVVLHWAYCDVCRVGWPGFLDDLIEPVRFDDQLAGLADRVARMVAPHGLRRTVEWLIASADESLVGESYEEMRDGLAAGEHNLLGHILAVASAVNGRRTRRRRGPRRS